MTDTLTLQIFLAIVPTVAASVISYIFYKLKKRSERQEEAEQQRAVDILKRDQATNVALRALCRDRILQGYRYYKHNGGVSAQDLESMTKLYHAYHDLGGNSIITVVYEKICNLPIKEVD